MRPLPLLAITAAAALCGPAQPLLGQTPPVPGRAWFEETVEYGFRFKAPKDWQFFPREFGQENVLGRYVPGREGQIQLDKGVKMAPRCWILAFDPERAQEQADPARSQREAMKERVTRYFPSFDTWLEANQKELGLSFGVKESELVSEEELKLKGKLRGTERIYELRGSPQNEKQRAHLWTTEYYLDDTRSIALTFNAPAARRDWAKWRSPLRKLARTFSRRELKGIDTSEIEGSGARAQKHKELLAEVAANPGWQLIPTPNYFILSNSDDGDFLKEIAIRLEAIREQYEQEFPAQKALAAYEARLVARGAAGEQDAASASADQEARSEVTEPSPLELSRCSVVRVCNNRQDYHRYGGPAGSAGYWWAVSEELVIYDDKAVGGRRNTWGVLHHEAFHQFIFYFFANLSPGTGFNEGNADFYSGFKLNKRKRYDRGRAPWRNSVIKEEIRTDHIVSLEELVGMTQKQYYGDNPLDQPRGSRYAQGWSFVYFLRTGKKNRAAGWQEEWGAILDTYLDTLIATGKIEEATEQAFAGVDWEALEEAWETYILKGK